MKQWILPGAVCAALLAAVVLLGPEHQIVDPATIAIGQADQPSPAGTMDDTRWIAGPSSLRQSLAMDRPGEGRLTDDERDVLLAEAMLMEHRALRAMDAAHEFQVDNGRMDAALAMHRIATERRVALERLNVDSTREDARRILRNHGPVDVVRAAPILRNALPFSRVLATAPGLNREDSVVPSYASPDPQPGDASDLASTTLVQVNQTVLAKAEELEYDYIRIVNFVRRDIRTEWYSGALKGAEQTLKTGSGNDVDQAALLIALLRASNVPARFVTGVVSVPRNMLQRWLGIMPSGQLLSVLSRAGIPHEPVFGATPSDLVEVHLEQTWVSAYLPYANYRGASVDLSSRTWVPMAPAVEAWAASEALWAFEDVELDSDFIVREYLEQDVDRSPLARVRSDIAVYLAQNSALGTLEQRLSGRESLTEPYRVIPSSLPFEVLSVRYEASDVPDSAVHSAQVEVIDAAGQTIMDANVPVAEFVGSDVWLEYIPASIEDYNIAREFGGLDRTPAYLLRVRPRLKLGGERVVAGESDVAMGELHTLRFTIRRGALARSMQRQLLAGNRIAMVITGQLESPLSTSVSTSPLIQLAQHYADRWNRAERELAALMNVYLVKPLPSVVMTAAEYSVTSIGGFPQELVLTGFNIDAAIRTSDPVADNSSDLERQFMSISGIEGSYWESELFQSLFGIRAISADLGLRQLLLAGGSVLTLDASSISLIDGTGHPQAVRDFVRQWVEAGMVAEIPGGLITKDQWTGSVWRLTDPQTGSAGYFIAGGLAGGENTEPPSEWDNPAVTDPLIFPNSDPSNKEPTEVVRLVKLLASDFQTTLVGTELPQPIIVQAIDIIGRPVEGVEILFEVTSGLEEPTSETVMTNAAGMARWKFDLPQYTSYNPGYFYLTPDDELPTQVARVTVDAKVKSSPDISIDTSFFAFGLPDDPAEILVEDSLLKGGLSKEFAGRVAFAVVDAHGNPVANVPVKMELLSATECGVRPAQSSPRTGTFFEVGQCLDKDPLDHFGTGNAFRCGGEEGTYASPTYGARFFNVVNGHSNQGASGVELRYRFPLRLSAPNLSPIELFSGNRFSALSAEDNTTCFAVETLSHYVKVVDPHYFKHSSPTFLPLGSDRQADINVAFGTFEQSGEVWTLQGLEQREIHVDYPETFPLTLRYFNGSDVVDLFPQFSGGFAQTTAQFTLSPAQEPKVVIPIVFLANVIFGAESDPFRIIPFGFPSADTRLARVHLPEPPIWTLDIGIGNEAVELPIDIQSGRLSKDVAVTYRVLPTPKFWDVRLILLEDGTQPVRQWALTTREPEGEIILPKGTLSLSTFKSYSFAIVVEPGEAHEYSTAPVPAILDTAVVSALTTDEDEAPSGGRVVNGQLLQKINLFHDADLPNGLVCANRNMTLQTTKAGRFDITLQKLDRMGNAVGSPYDVVVDQSYPAGDNEIEINPFELGGGEFAMEVIARPDDGSPQETTVGRVNSSVILRNTLPVGHSIVKGVDLADGSYTESSQDIAVPGLNGGLSFSRTYSSGRREVPGPLGFGWVHNHMSRVTQGRCGQWYVSGTDGGSMTFVESLDGFQPLKGYHGTLERSIADGGFDFYAKSGKRYHYTKRQDRTWWLDYTEDTNGNRTEISYRGSNKPLISEIREAGGRKLKLVYEPRSFSRFSGDVITRVEGPGGIELTFEYNGDGDLETVSRENGSQIMRYGYTQFLEESVLETITDDLSGATRRVEFDEYGLQISVQGASSIPIVTAAVTSVREPDMGLVQFDYTLGSWGMNATANVIDARGFTTNYTMNSYGAAVEIDAPQGSRRYTWNTTTDVLLMAEVDENGRRTEYQYDEYGNRTRETVGDHTRTWSYYPPGFFTLPGIKNRVREAIDWRSIPTTFRYDGKGNRIEERRDGLRSRFAYDDRGLRIAATDARSHTTTYAHDQLGNVKQITDALGNVSSFRHDNRSRQVQVTDANGEVTTMAFDDRDREIEKAITTLLALHPDPAMTPVPETVTHRVTYDDELRRRTEIDPRGHQTIYEHDVMGRLVWVRNALNDERVMEYDFNGNITSETDFEGRETTYEYDGANRLERKTEPLGRISTYEYDSVGNLTAEVTNGRLTEYDYDPDRYFQTEIRRPEGQTVQRQFDGNGNVVLETDPLGREMSITYDAFDRPLDTSGPLGSSLQREYDENGNVLRTVTLLGDNLGDGQQVRTAQFDALNRRTVTTDAVGASTTFEYDPVGNVIRVVGPRQETTESTFNGLGWVLYQSQIYGVNHAVTRFIYDPAGNVVEEHWPNGNVITRSYDVLNRRESEADSIGAIGAWTYDAVGNVLTEADGNGNVATHTYNDLNQRTQSDLPENRTLSWTYTVFNEVLTETDARGNTVAHTVDDLGRRLTTTGPENLSQAMTYDAANNLLTQTDSRNTVITNTYNDLNQRVTESITGSEGDRIWTRSFTYDAVGNLLREVDRRGIETVMTYDAENRPLITSRAGERKEERRYDLAGNLTTRLDANGNPVTYEYDRRNLMVRENRPELQVTSYTRDVMGDVLVEDLPGPAALTRTYDLRRRMETETNAASETVTYEYDLNNNQTARVTAKNQRWQYAFDGANRLFQITDPLTFVTTYGYDGNGNMTSLTDANNHVSTYVYDARNRRTEKAYPDTTLVEYDYDANDNLTEIRQPNGTTSTFTFDALNQLVQEDHGGNGELINVEFTLDENGNPTLVDQTGDDAVGAASNRYDEDNRPERMVDLFGRTMDLVYDPQGNPETIRDFIGQVETRTYDSLNRLKTLGYAGVGTYTFTYGVNGRVETMEGPSGAISTYGYDNANRIVDIHHTQASATVARIEYAYDKNGNRTEERLTNGAGERLTTYAYDDVDRLIRITTPEDETICAIDGAGNRETEIVTVGGIQTENKVYSYDSRDRLETIADSVSGDTQTFDYDAAGNQITQTIEGVTTDFDYTVRNRIKTVTVQGAPPIAYEYNHRGLRMAKDQNGTRTQSVYDHTDNLCGRTNAPGNLLERHVRAGSRLLGTLQSGGTTHHLNDALGTPIAALNTVGTVAGRYRYDAWGEVEEQSGQAPTFGFTGYELNPETDGYYAQQRFYQPQTGRFNTVDPVEGQLMVPMSYHRYLYGYGNPTVFVDPDGRCGRSYVGGLSPSVVACLEDNAALQTGGSQRDAALRAAYRAEHVNSSVSAGGMSGLGRLAWKAVVGASVAVTTIGGAAAEQYTFGALDFGYRESLVDGVADGLEFLSNDPYGQTVLGVSDRMSSINEEWQKGNYFEAAAQYSELAAEGGTAVFGGSQLPKLRHLSGPDSPSSRVIGEGADSPNAVANPYVDKDVIRDLESQTVINPDRLIDHAPEQNYVLFNKSHATSQPRPKGKGPSGGRLQSHHGLQQQWARENLSEHGYDPNLAPTITIETGSGFPHTIISKLQNSRRNSRVAEGDGKWSSTLQNELQFIESDMRQAGFSDATIRKTMEQQYSMLDNLGVLYERLDK